MSVHTTTSWKLAGVWQMHRRSSSCHGMPASTLPTKASFHWDRREPSPCFFLAMEVIVGRPFLSRRRPVHHIQDNFAHDMIRYDYRTLEPHQALITVDAKGDYGIYYTRVTDPLIASFLNLRRRLGHPPPLPSILKSPSVRSIYNHLPFAPNLSTPEYVPTRLLSLLRTLRTHFPRHRLLLSDFSSLPRRDTRCERARRAGARARDRRRVLDALRPAGPLRHLLPDALLGTSATCTSMCSHSPYHRRRPLAPRTVTRSPAARRRCPPARDSSPRTSRRTAAHPSTASRAPVGYPSASASRTCSRMRSLWRPTRTSRTRVCGAAKTL
jgi:hypothetical protein